MLRSFHAQGFKSLQDVALELGSLNVAFGPNGSGKSNFCEALYAYSRLVHEKFAHKALETLDRTDRIDLFNASTRGEESDLPAALEFGLGGRLEPSDGRWLEYTTKVRYEPAQGQLGIAAESLVAFGGEAHEQRGPVFTRWKDDEDPTGGYISRSLRTDGEEHLLMLSRELPSGTFAAEVRSVEPRDESSAVGSLLDSTCDVAFLSLDDVPSIRADAEPARADSIGRHGEHLAAFLHRLLNDSAAEAARARAALLRAIRSFLPELEQLTTVVNSSTGRVAFRALIDGAWMSSGSLSDGSLRVIAICAEALNPYSKGLLLLEEPELGIHPQRIELVASLLSGASRKRQVFVSTHSPMLVGEFVRLALEDVSIDAKLLGFTRGPNGTQVRPFEPSDSVFNDEEIRDSVGAADPASTARELLIRGWING